MGICFECGLDVEWKRDGKRLQCFNPDGSVHWDKCSQERFERIKRTGEYFKTDCAEGYVTPFKSAGVQYTMLAAGPVGSIDTAGCNQCVPPWETCPNKCPIEFKAML